MVITIKYADGTTENFSSVTEWSIDGDVLSITGKIDGQTKEKKHRIRWSTVRRIEVETL